jgi:head-tail adaptor
MLKSKDKIGTLDREITFIKAIIENGVSNEDKITGWEEIDSYPNVTAKKLEEGGSTFMDNERVTYVRNTTWIIRFRDDLNVRMRLVWDTQVYQILNIAEVGETRRRYMEVTTSLIDQVFFT